MPPGSAPLDSQVPGSGQPQVPSAEIPAGIAPVSEQQPAAAETQATGATDELKKTHEPVIILPDRLEMGQMVNAKVKVGMIGHVMDSAHYIESIELFLNDQSIGKVDLKLGENIVAEADFQVSLVSGSQLKAVAICNVHGKWECVRGIQ
ncbi:class II SORL domain-containing protein [Patescibacteria group bacterium]|nr:class II SORL domain-containing protein [Patescibacteria group bacterium]